MTQIAINPGNVPNPEATGVKRGRLSSEKRFSFSLRYWRQRDDFGLGSVNSSWFISVLERLKELGSEKIERFLNDPHFKDAVRYHSVDWGARNIPIGLNDLDWLPQAVLNNTDEFPLVQFHISKALGRVHGYWDQDWCFQIVLLDPLHNLQPSKRVKYKVRPTTTASCVYSSLLVAIDQACKNKCAYPDCGLLAKFDAIRLSQTSDQYAVVIGMDKDISDSLDEILSRGNGSLIDVLDHGVIMWEQMNDAVKSPSSPLDSDE